MAFILPDLVVESIIRDGFENARRDLTIVDDIFQTLSQAHLSSKYEQDINQRVPDQKD